MMPGMARVSVPVDDELVRYLRGSGGKHEGHLNGMANAADSRSGGAVDVPPSVAEDVTTVLLRARKDGSPAVVHLEEILRQLGAPVPVQDRPLIISADNKDPAPEPPPTAPQRTPPVRTLPTREERPGPVLPPAGPGNEVPAG
jgi:hypothetical protein